MRTFCPINQSIKRSSNQSINRTHERMHYMCTLRTNGSINQSIDPSTNQSNESNDSIIQSINQPTNQQNQIKPNQIHRTPTSLPNGSLRGSWNSLPHAHRPSGGRIINHAWDASNASKGRLRFAFSPNASALYILPRHRSLFFNCQGHIFRTHARSCDISSLCYFT